MEGDDRGFRARRQAFGGSLCAVLLVTLFQAAAVFSLLGYAAGLLTFLAVMGVLEALSCLLWRFAMGRPEAGNL